MSEKTEGSNQEWTIQRNWQHRVHKTQVEEKQNKKHNTENQNDEQHGPHQKNPTPGVTPGDRDGQVAPASHKTSARIFLFLFISLLPAVQSGNICEDRTKLMQSSKCSSSAGTGIALHTGLY